MGAIFCARFICSTLKLETPIQRILPCSLKRASVSQPSSISFFGLGQWIW